MRDGTYGQKGTVLYILENQGREVMPEGMSSACLSDIEGQRRHLANRTFIYIVQVGISLGFQVRLCSHFITFIVLWIIYIPTTTLFIVCISSKGI
jgi:hypothetical protein